MHSFTDSFSKRIGTCFAPGPVHSFQQESLSTYYVLGGVNRTDLIFTLPVAGGSPGPDVPCSWSAQAARPLPLLCQAC